MEKIKEIRYSVREKNTLSQEILIAISVLYLVSNNPKVDFINPLNANEVKLLKLYTQYPEINSEDKLRELLTLYKQDDFLKISNIK